MRTTTITGRVLWINTPVPDFPLALYKGVTGLRNSIATTRSGADGTFRFEEVPEDSAPVGMNSYMIGTGDRNCYWTDEECPRGVFYIAGEWKAFSAPAPAVTIDVYVLLPISIRTPAANATVSWPFTMSWDPIDAPGVHYVVLVARSDPFEWIADFPSDSNVIDFASWSALSAGGYEFRVIAQMPGLPDPRGIHFVPSCHAGYFEACVAQSGFSKIRISGLAQGFSATLGGLSTGGTSTEGISQEPLVLSPGQSGTFTAQFFNTGAEWTRGTDSQVDLVRCCPENTSGPNASWAVRWLSSTRYATQTQSTCSSGSTACHFSFTVSVPAGASPGDYAFEGRLAVAATAQGFGPRVVFTVRVPQP